MYEQIKLYIYIVICVFYMLYMKRSLEWFAVCLVSAVGHMQNSPRDTPRSLLHQSHLILPLL